MHYVVVLIQIVLGLATGVLYGMFAGSIIVKRLPWVLAVATFIVGAAVAGVFGGLFNSSLVFMPYGLSAGALILMALCRRWSKSKTVES